MQIEHKVLNKCGNRVSLDIVAKENTWSKQRRKRRLLKKMETTNAKKLKSDTDEIINVEPSLSAPENTDISTTKSNAVESTIENNQEKTEIADKYLFKSGIDGPNITIQSSPETEANNKLKLENKSTNGKSSKTDAANTIKIENSAENIISDSTVQCSKSQKTPNTEPLIHAFIIMYKKDETIQLEIEFIDGTGGKESVYQIVQYIKNNWK